MGDNSTENIIQFISKLDYQHIPKDAVLVAKKDILDWIGVTLAAKEEPLNKIATEYVKQLNAVGEATVVGGDLRTSAEFAAWLNGMSSHALDYDTTFSHGYNMHPTVVALPPALALGEKYHMSGAEVITAYIAGIEVLSRIGERIGEANSKLGWHPTSILGSISAVAASGWILKLNATQLKTALGIASSLASGLRENFGTMVKPMHAGNAARNGVLAALLAKNGFTASENILENPFGFYSIFSNGEVNEKVKDELGDRWDIVSKGITYKLYPCCRGTHSGIDATLYLLSKYGINAADVTSITCKTSPFVPKTLIHHRPKTELEAKFSLEYCVAAALIRGKVTFESFTDEAVNETSVQELLRKVQYSHPAEWPSGISLTQEIVITLKDGTEYSHKVSIPKGDPRNSITNEELIAKFQDCVTTSLKQGQTEKVIKTVSELDSLTDVSELMMLIT